MSPTARSKSRTACLICALALAGLSMARVSLAVEPPNPKDLLLGNWVMDLEKSKFCNPAEAPKQDARSVVDEGFGMVSVHWTGIAANGMAIDRRYVYFNDGHRVPAGEFNGVSLDTKESMTFHLVNPRRLTWEHWSKDGKLTSTYVREISADGQTMTQTNKLLNRPGCADVEVFRRQ